MAYRSILGEARPILLSGLSIRALTRVVTIQLHPVRTETLVADSLVLGHVDANVGAEILIAVTAVVGGLVKEAAGEDLQVHCALDILFDDLHALAPLQLIHLVDRSPSPVIPNEEIFVNSDAEGMSCFH